MSKLRRAMNALHDIRHLYDQRLTIVPQVLERDEKSKEHAPEIIKEEIDGTKNAADSTTFANLYALGQMENIANGGHGHDPVELYHRYDLPNLPLPSNANLHYRYDPVVNQVTNLLMQHGKLSVAQRVGSSVSLFHSTSVLLCRSDCRTIC